MQKASESIDREVFYNWTAPKELLSLAEKKQRQVGHDWLIKPDYSWLREAWVTAKVGTLLNADQACLCPKDPPDAKFMINRCEELVECVEAMNLNRRRGDEYKKMKKQKRNNNGDLIAKLPGAEILEFMDESIDVFVTNSLNSIADVCNKKATKKYPPSINLIVYANISRWESLSHDEWQTADDAIVSNLETATSAAGEEFKRVWVLLREQVYTVWENGKSVAQHG